jgi:hypothetical protein
MKRIEMEERVRVVPREILKAVGNSANLGGLPVKFLSSLSECP